MDCKTTLQTATGVDEGIGGAANTAIGDNILNKRL